MSNIRMKSDSYSDISNVPSNGDVDTKIASRFYGGQQVESLPNNVGLITKNSGSTSDENLLNRIRLTEYEEKYTSILFSYISEDDFEYGFDSKLDYFINDLISTNRYATLIWLNALFTKYFSNPKILLGLLRIISRMEYNDIYPIGQTMAVAALSHKSDEIKEFGVRAFEYWNNLNSLEILGQLHGNTEWLQDYIDEVASTLRRKYNVGVRQEN